MRILIAYLSILVLATSAHAENGPTTDGKFSLSAGLEYSTGKYGNTTATTIWYLPVTSTYQNGDWTFSATIPYLWMSGPGGVVRGFGNLASAPATAQGSGFGKAAAGGGTITHSGLGDVLIAAGYLMYTSDVFRLDGSGKAKLGTADANAGLGTGQNDYAVQLDAYYLLADRTTLLPSIGYKFVGQPAGIPVRNVPYGSLGLDQKISESGHVGLLYEIARNPVPTLPDLKDAVLYASTSSGYDKLAVRLTRGFTSSSPDWSVGLLLTRAF